LIIAAPVRWPASPFAISAASQAGAAEQPPVAPNLLEDYDLLVREITARNNPFHQPFVVQFPGEYRFHMARMS
jgi:hypothetical protein